MTKGYAYWHGATLFWSETRGFIKHHNYKARLNDRYQWGTSQTPGPLVQMTREEAEGWEGFWDISH